MGHLSHKDAAYESMQQGDINQINENALMNIDGHYMRTGLHMLSCYMSNKTSLRVLCIGLSHLCFKLNSQECAGMLCQMWVGFVISQVSPMHM